MKILIGQFDSPFVRRVAVTMNLYALSFERRVVSVFTNFDEMLTLNPLGKVPVLENGERLFDSRMIIDYLDHLVPDQSRLVPNSVKHRRHIQRIEAVALGQAEKCYERGIECARRRPDKIDPDWTDRLGTQISSALAWLERCDPAPWLYGNTMTQADAPGAIADKQQRVIMARHCVRLALSAR